MYRYGILQLPHIRPNKEHASVLQSQDSLEVKVGFCPYFLITMFWILISAYKALTHTHVYVCINGKQGKRTRDLEAVDILIMAFTD